jgi:hypothetical protein
VAWIYGIGELERIPAYGTLMIRDRGTPRQTLIRTGRLGSGRMTRIMTRIDPKWPDSDRDRTDSDHAQLTWIGPGGSRPA